MIMNPTAIKHVVVDGHSLTLESFVAIARYNATVELAPSALEAMRCSGGPLCVISFSVFWRPASGRLHSPARGWRGFSPSPA